MSYGSSEGASKQPEAPWDPVDAPLTPGQGPTSPSTPFGPLNSSLSHIGPFRSPGLLYKSSEDPSYFAVDQMGHLAPPTCSPGTLKA